MGMGAVMAALFCAYTIPQIRRFENRHEKHFYEEQKMEKFDIHIIK